MTIDTFIQDAAKAAGAEALRLYGKAKGLYSKSERPGDIVTKADFASEKVIIMRIKKKYPKHGIISEEMGSLNTEAEYVWVIDPIDGTLNYAWSVPLFGVMVALMHKGKVVLSAVYLPVVNELYFAKRGEGAYLNGKKIRCSKRAELERSLGCVGSGLKMENIKFLSNFLKLAKGKHAVMFAYGSPAVAAAYVASGRRDWCASWSRDIHDYAPISLLLLEAGCKVTGKDGKLWTPKSVGLVAANPKLHKKIFATTRGI